MVARDNDECVAAIGLDDAGKLEKLLGSGRFAACLDQILKGRDATKVRLVIE